MKSEVIQESNLDKFQGCKHLLCSHIDEELILLDIQNGCYYGLNSIGAVIWQLLQEPMTVTQLSQAVIKVYDISVKQAYPEIITFLEKLKLHQLIILCE